MTWGWTGVCRPVFRKAPSSNYRKLPSYHFYDEFWRKATHFLVFFTNLWITHPCLWKICRKRDPCLENFGPKNPPIWAAHTRTLNMLCTPPPPGVDSTHVLTTVVVAVVVDGFIVGKFCNHGQNSLRQIKNLRFYC